MDLRSILALSVLITASAWPSGAPAEACRTRTPSHGVPAQTSTCPFDFVGLGWIPGQFTSMGIFPTRVGSSLKFRGFLASVYKDDEPIGEMRPGNSDKNLVKTACNGKSSITIAATKIKMRSSLNGKLQLHCNQPMRWS
ncbi:hypothetical protein EB796_006768 [Bugula neritina]|uniref:Reelin domain-containing protein n=1 Tax=Bugula neritina TaxID=10212 RepID=A0A7J7K8F7_BUGNE|nr:hypothetical protein EB796_006768 [Bugula neritina]